MENALKSLENYLQTTLSEGNICAFNFLYKTWDMTRITNFTYRLISLSVDDDGDENGDDAQRTALVNFIAKLMPRSRKGKNKHNAS